MAAVAHHASVSMLNIIYHYKILIYIYIIYIYIYICTIYIEGWNEQRKSVSGRLAGK